MTEVGKLKALFEPKAAAPEPKTSSPVVISRSALIKKEPNKSEGITTPWGVRLRPVNMVRSKSINSMCNKRETERSLIRMNRSGSAGNEVDDSSLLMPSHLFHKGVRATRNVTAHSSYSTTKTPNGRPPLAPKPAMQTEKSINFSRKPTKLKDQHSRSVDCLADYGKECLEQGLINVYPQSPVFPRKSTSPSKEEGLQASPALNSLSPTSQRSSLQDADTIQEDRPVTVQEEAKEKSGTVESQQKYESPLYLRRKPQSPILAQNMEQISSVIAQQSVTNSTVRSAASDSTPVVAEDRNFAHKKNNSLSPDAKHNSGSSTPVFSSSPLISSQMMEEFFERSKSAFKVGDIDSGDISPHKVLEYSCSPSKVIGSKLDSDDEEDDSSELFRKKSENKDEFMFPMEYSKNSLDTDSGNQLRLSDVSSEYESISKSPMLDSACNDHESPSCPGNEKLSKAEKDRRERFNIASELLETEKAYASRLKLISEDFRAAVVELNSKGKAVIPESVIPHIFLNIRQIHTLSLQILSDLQKRMDNWEEIEEIGDVLSTLAPFLKLYSIYTSGFEDAIKLLTEWTKKEKRFDILVKNFEHQQVICQGLGIADFMLEPVQRIPRYKLLLEAYLKHLEADSPERKKTEEALNIIREAANKANSKIHQLENTNDILTIQRSLIDWDSPLLIPSRRFIKKGSLLKCARKNTQQRMFFLFNDMLLHAVPSGGDTYKLRNELPLYGMSVHEPKISSVPHSFHVISTARSLQLAASSSEEKADWVSTLHSSIRAETQKRKSLKRESLLMMKDERFAMKAPVWIQDRSVSMCMVCAMPFKLMFRRHHCRGCGKVLCTNCTQWKVYLPYLRKIDRVCFECYHLGSGQQQQNIVDQFDSPLPSKRNKGLLNLSGTDDDDAVTAGYLLYQDGRKWTKHWYLLRRDMALYRFKAPSDVRAIESIPLPGYALSKEKYKEALLIKLKHPGATHSFKCESEEEWERWYESLTRACNMEFSPEPDDEDLASTDYSKQRLETIVSYDETNSLELEDTNSLGRRDSMQTDQLANSYQDCTLDTGSSNSDGDDN